jgi:LysR family transcriptional activator of glutamate synthase operon
MRYCHGMDVQTLRWFQLVADGATVTEVAELHLVSQPGVSRALARLEQEVGSPLLLRSGRMLRSTHAGAVFKRHVDIALHHVDDGLAAVNELIDPETGSVSIAFQLSLGAWLVPDLIDSFRRHHRRVRFRLHSSDDALGSMVLANSHLDLELTARRPSEEGVRWEHLFTQPLVLAVPLGHPLADRSEVRLEEVADEDFVMLRPSWELRAQTDALCRAAGFTPRSAFESDDLAVVRGFVAAGLGVAIVPADGFSPGETYGRERHLGIVDAGANRDVGLAWLAERRLLPSAELFRRHVIDRSRRAKAAARRTGVSG